MDRVLLIDKPAGRTSHDVVAAVRRTVGGPRKGPGVIRVGHAGTLDPFATGLLIVLTGRATKAQSLFMGLGKSYEVTARFGAVSSTGDPEGQITETGVLPARPLALPTGVIRQRPPAFSAVRIDGERAYTRARRGEVVEMPEREVTVHRFDALSDCEFRIECSSGTYVRSLIADLGDAYCTALRRTAIGPFDVADSPRQDSVETGIPLADALARFLAVVVLEGDDARRAGHGVAVAAPGSLGAAVAARAPGSLGAAVAARAPGSLGAAVAVAAPAAPDLADEAPILLRDADGPIALAQRRPDGWLKPVVGLRG